MAGVCGVGACSCGGAGPSGPSTCQLCLNARGATITLSNSFGLVTLDKSVGYPGPTDASFGGCQYVTVTGRTDDTSTGTISLPVFWGVNCVGGTMYISAVWRAWGYPCTIVPSGLGTACVYDTLAPDWTPTLKLRRICLGSPDPDPTTCVTDYWAVSSDPCGLYNPGNINQSDSAQVAVTYDPSQCGTPFYVVGTLATTHGSLFSGETVTLTD